MQIFFVSMSLFFLGSSAFADFDQVCEDLQKLTCAPGIYNDGTGSAQNPGYLSNKAAAIRLKLLQKGKADFSKVLADPENGYFRKMVLSATGLSANPVCEGADKSPNSECLELLAIGTTELIAKEEFETGSNSGRGYNSMGSISDTTFVTDSDIFKGVQENIVRQLKKELDQNGVELKIRQKVFPKVKKILMDKIDLMVKDAKVRDSLKDKVNAIQYSGFDCSENGDSKIPGLLTSNASYNPVKNTFKYCSGLGLQNDSEFQMAFVIAHELAHSIDPCGITRGPSDFTFKYKLYQTIGEAEVQYPFTGVVQCLRTDSSVGALTKQQMMSKGTGVNPYQGGYVTAAGSMDSSPPSFCDSDQATESFADWMASEVVPDYIQGNYPKLTSKEIRFGYSNIWRGMCRSKDSQPVFQGVLKDVHPDQEKRINRIILTQPKIRAQMQCSGMASGRKYCPILDEKKLQQDENSCATCEHKADVSNKKEGSR